MKKIALMVAMAGAFLIGYGADVKAWPIMGRAEYNGWFTNTPDSSGTHVLPLLYDGGANAIPNSINTAAELVNFVVDDIRNGNAQERTGAQFIVDSMGPMSRVRHAYNSAVVEQWITNVYYASARGFIVWNAAYPHLYNSFYQATGSGTNPNDDALYDDPATSTSITFRGNASATVKYGIRRQCANPVGTNSMGPLDNVVYTLTGRTTVDDTTAIPGQTVNFSHYVRNNGPSSAGTGVQIYWVAESTSPGAVAVVGGPATMGGVPPNTEDNVFNHPVLIPANAAVGTQYCERTGWDPTNSSGGANGRSTPACTTVTGTYDLYPTAPATATTAQDGDTVRFNYYIENTGTATSPDATCYVRDGNNVAVSVLLTCGFGQQFAPAGGVPRLVGYEDVVFTNQTPGTQVCRTLYIAPQSSSSAAVRPSTQTCVVVAKTPYVHFGGNDVWAGGGFQAVTPGCNISAKITTVGRALGGTAPTQYAGSSVEYNAFALNRVSSFGSAGRALAGTGALGDAARSMTFANNDATLANLGFYGAAQHCIQDYSSLYESLTVGASQPITNGTSGAWHVSSIGSIGGAVPAGVNKVYYSDGDVTITSNITYPATYANAAAIPSVLIIAKGNIYVSAGVTRLDGIFVTRGTMYTCYPKTEPATVGICNQQLTVNGAVMANSLDLFRTAGADGATTTTRKAPAELFNFTPEVYLRSAINQTAQPTVQVINAIELPPRF